MKYILIACTAVLILSCRKTNNPELSITACVQSRIDSALAKPKGTLFTQVTAYKYGGNTVYLYQAGCCDRYNELWDNNCTYLFSPTGGIAGCGDCSNTDFYTQAKLIGTVWTDPRP